MNFKELESVLAVYHHHSFSEAAHQTAFSLSAISKHVSHVEDELGIRLFERKTKASEMDLTEDGKHVFPIITQIVGDYQALLKQVERCKGMQERSLSIGYLPLIGSVGETEIITDFYMQHPEMTVNATVLYSKDLLALLDSGKLDAIFMLLIGEFEVYRSDWELLSDNTLRFVPTMRHTQLHIGISADHPLASRESIDLRDLKDMTFIFSNSQNPKANTSVVSRVRFIERLIGDRIEDAKITYMDFQQKDVVLNLVAKNYGVVPCSCYNGEEFPGVKLLPVEGWNQPVTGVFVYKANNISGPLNEFKRCVESYAQRNQAAQ